MDQESTPCLLIETSDGLRTLVPRLAREPRLAFDLEADSLYHYQEKICLVQLASEKECYLLDTLKIEDCSPLGPLFDDPAIQKILHGADYDIRSLFRDYRFSLQNLFDTELAARFLGLKETGLEALLGGLFQVQLDKRFQRTDWSKRPLTPPMLAYAGADVAYLIPMARRLKDDLQRLDRWDWVREEGEWLCRVRPQPPYTGPLFLRFKGARHLDPRSLGVLESLLQFRREQAEKINRPVFKIIGPEPLKELAVIKPESPDQMKGIPGLSPKLISRMGEGLIQAVRRGLDLSDDDLPRFPRIRTVPAQGAVVQRVKSLKQWREIRAAELQLEPGLLLNNVLIDQVARLNPVQGEELDRIPELRLWQKRTFGEEIVKAIQPLKKPIGDPRETTGHSPEC